MVSASLAVLLVLPQRDVHVQGDEHHCREVQGIVGFLGNIPALNRNNQPVEMRVLTNLKDTVALYGHLDWADSDLR
jgi:hypothetical protein